MDRQKQKFPKTHGPVKKATRKVLMTARNGTLILQHFVSRATRTRDDGSLYSLISTKSLWKWRTCCREMAQRVQAAVVRRVTPFPIPIVHYLFTRDSIMLSVCLSHTFHYLSIVTSWKVYIFAEELLLTLLNHFEWWSVCKIKRWKVNATENYVKIVLRIIFVKSGSIYVKPKQKW